MSEQISTETSAPLPNYTEFWAPADRADRLHTPNKKRGFRITLGATVVGGLAIIGGLANHSAGDWQYGQKVAPRTEEGTYVPLPTLQTTTTINPCIAEFKQLFDVDPLYAHTQYTDCRDNPLSHAFANLNAQMTTTTTTPPRN